MKTQIQIFKVSVNKVKLIVLIFLLMSTTTFAQIETTLPSLRSMYQSSYTNPAYKLDHKFNMGLPIISNFVFNFGLNNFDLGTISKNIDTAGILDLNQLSRDIDNDRFGFRTGIVTDLLYVGFHVKDFYIGLGMTTRFNIDANLSKEFLNGSIFLKGQTVDFAGTNFEMLSYTETHVTVSKDIKKFRVGARVKYLTGHANFAMEDIKMNTTTSNEVPYDIRLRAGGRIVTAGMPVLADKIDGKDVTEEQKSFSSSDLINFGGGNSGWGLDLGITYQPTEKWFLQAAITDMGYINWRNKTFIYNLGNIDINYTGLSYEQLNTPEQRSAYIDSLTAIIDNSNIITSSFSRALPTRYMIGAEYHLNEKNRLGIMIQGQQLISGFRTAYTASFTKYLFDNWLFTANYSLIDNQNSAVGIGWSFRTGPLQFFFVQDNILSIINMGTARTLNFRMGMNIAIGRTNNEKKAPAIQAPAEPDTTP
jgi:hypothetical protein